MQRASTVGVAWALVALVASSSCDAFSVTNGPIAPLNPAADHRFLEQTYSVGQGLVGDLLNHESLQTLKLSIPGRVFVSYNYDLRSNPSEPSAWPLAAATIRFSGNSEDIFQYFEVVSTAPHVVEVRHRSNVRGYISDAYLLTEISVSQSHAISQIVTSGSADVIIEDQVLVSGGENALKLKLAGSGSVYIDSKSSSLLGKTSIESSGSGSVHWSTGSLQTESLELSLQGSGDFTLIGQSLVTTSIEVAIAGSGDVCVDATSIQTNSLTTATIGSGEISFSAASAHCNHEDISILGSGDVYVGAIQCNDAKVTLAGSGDVYVQAVQSIHGSAYGSGDVKYVGATPQRISDRYDSSRFSSENNKKYHPIAKPKATNTATTCRPGSIPPRAAIHVNVSVWKVDGSSILGPLVFFCNHLALLSKVPEEASAPQPPARASVRSVPPTNGARAATAAGGPASAAAVTSLHLIRGIIENDVDPFGWSWGDPTRPRSFACASDHAAQPFIQRSQSFEKLICPADWLLPHSTLLVTRSG